DAARVPLSLKREWTPMSDGLAVMNSAIDSFNPLGSSPFDVPAQAVSPSIIDPMVQIWTNKTWYGAPMYPDKNPFASAPKPDSQLYRRSTSQASKKLANILGGATG